MSLAGRGQGKGDWKSRPFGAVAWEELLSFVVLGSYGWCTGLHSMDFFSLSITKIQNKTKKHLLPESGLLEAWNLSLLL